jgi:hypothetical protein
VNERAWSSVVVSALLPDECDYCGLYDDAVRPVTHTVEITHWYGPYGATARYRGCEKHAREIADAIRAAGAPK